MSTRPLSRRRVVRCALLLVAPLAPIVGRRRAAVAGPAGDYCPDAEERAFLRLINDLRSANGLSPLRLSRGLGAAAAHHSRDMAARDYFDHLTPDGESPGDRAAAHGYPSRYVGENIAAGMTTADAAFRTWEGSAGHRANMLGAGYTAIGIGRAQGGGGARYGWYWTTVFGDAFDAAPGCGGNGGNGGGDGGGDGGGQPGRGRRRRRRRRG